MKSFLGIIERPRLGLRSALSLPILFCIHTVICCVSLIQVANLFQAANQKSHILYDSDRLLHAVIVVAAFAAVSLLFLVARFSFGYFVGFYLYSMVVGFQWLNCFSKFNYDHKLAAFSAAASMLLFLLPALLSNAPIKQAFELSPQALKYLLKAILVLALVTIITASAYNFRLVSLAHIYDFRNDLYFPTIINYLIGIVSGALLPFAFACYLALNYRWWAGATLLVLLFFYPVTLSKLAFFEAAWIIALVILSRIFESRIATILSLHLPMLIGVMLMAIFPSKNQTLYYFNMVNIRMIATPSSAMDIYNDFFSNHPLTYFCQISLLKPLMHCPYQEPLAIVMQNAYGLGNMNASLFATEGIASVGLFFAPLAALACGLVIALANRLSAGLPPRFILISGAVFPQILLNVPLTITLLTHGAAILFLLWYATPRTLFEQKTSGQAAPAA